MPSQPASSHDQEYAVGRTSGKHTFQVVSDSEGMLERKYTYNGDCTIRIM